MTRKFLMTSTTIATLIAAPVAIAASDSMTDTAGNSPAVTDSGNDNVVGSTAGTPEVGTKRPGIGIAEYDPARMAMSEEEYAALAASVGADFETQDEEVLGTVQGVTFDAQGNPELVVDLMEDTQIDAETLVVTLLPDSVTLRDGKIFLDTTADELYLKAQQGSKRDDETRTTVIVM